MKPLFTIHEGEFLVGDHISRTFGHKFDVWVPTKDSGVDLLVTRARRRGKAVALQVKFSRSFDIHKELVRHVIATSWYTLNPKKVRKSEADLWVFVILTLRHERHFVVIPTRELLRRIPSAGARFGTCTSGCTLTDRATRYAILTMRRSLGPRIVASKTEIETSRTGWKTGSCWTSSVGERSVGSSSNSMREGEKCRQTIKCVRWTMPQEMPVKN
jgi:hypothetical protein